MRELDSAFVWNFYLPPARCAQAAKPAKKKNRITESSKPKKGWISSIGFIRPIGFIGSTGWFVEIVKLVNELVCSLAKRFHRRARVLSEEDDEGQWR